MAKGRGTAGRSGGQEELRALLQGQSKEALEKLLLEMAGEDPAVERRIRTRFGQGVSEEDIRQVRRQADQIMAAHVGSGYLGRGNGFAYSMRVGHFLDTQVAELIRQGALVPAAEIALEIFNRTASLYIDDEISAETVLTSCTNVWGGVLDAASAQVRAEVYALLDRKIGIGSYNEFYGDYRELMEKKFSSEDRTAGLRLEAQQLRGEILSETGEVEEVRIQYKRRELIEICEQLGDTLMQREVLLECFLSPKGGAIGDYKALKKLYTDEEWLQVREQILGAVKDRTILCSIYAAEGMTEPLYALVFGTEEESFEELEERVELLGSCGMALAAEHSEEILQTYQSQIFHVAENVRREETKQKVRKLLEQMREYPGGKEAVVTLVEVLIRRHPGRRAFNKELRELAGKA